MNLKWLYYWRTDNGFYATTDKVLADMVLKGGRQTVFLHPIKDNQYVPDVAKRMLKKGKGIKKGGDI